MAGHGPQPGAHVTYSLQYRRCSKPGCPPCAAAWSAGHILPPDEGIALGLQVATRATDHSAGDAHPVPW